MSSSTNYDICIEQFCNKHSIHFVDTFDPTLNTKNGHNKQDADLILYKLNGSTTWYRTEQGDYIMSTAGEVRNIHGKPMVPLILYPRRKFEFFG